MPIDITKMEGYKPELTADEKLALYAKYEPPAPDLTGFIKKSMFDQTASELAEAKKALKAKMSENEQKEAERLANEAAIKTELENLRKENAVTKHKSNFLGLGYDDALATDAAKALADGDLTKVFANQKIHIENVKKAERASALAGDPRPPAGVAPTPGAIDYGKAIAEAQANSDYGLAAMLMRQQQEATIKK
jgi:hypothetical protein